MFKFIAYCVVSFLIIFAPITLLAETTSVMWSGVGFTGDWGTRHRHYPVTSSLFCDSETVCDENMQIEKWARERILQSKKYPFEIRLEKVDERNIEQIGMAVTISRESVMHEKVAIDGEIKYLENYSLSGAAIFFDLKSRKMIASAPLITRYTRIYETVPSEKERYSIFKSMLSNDDLGLNFFDEMSKKLLQVQLNSLPSQYIQIKSLKIEPTVHPAVASSPNKDLFSSYLSTFFENRLLESSGIALIPNSIGHAIGNKIATRLPSGDMTITLPDPGYTLDFRIHKLIFQKKPAKVTDCLCWGGVLSLNVSKHMFGDENIASFGLRDINCATVDKGMSLDDYVEYQKLMMGLLDGLAQQFGTLNNKWIGEKTLDKKKSKKAIKMLSKEFKSTML